MKTIIVEDEPLSTDELRNCLKEVAPRIEVAAVARSVKEAVEVIGSTPHDLIFMDIHLGDGNSFDIFKQVKVSVPVIFITAYDTYALKAFENQGIDYLLKPFGREDLRRALDKLDLLSRSAPGAGNVREQLPYQERFLVNMGARMKSVSVGEIAYFMADGKYLHLYTHGGNDYILDQTIAGVSGRVSPSRFFRINRKFIVSFDAIREMVRYSNNRIKITLFPPPPENQESIVSADRVQEFRAWLNR